MINRLTKHPIPCNKAVVESVFISTAKDELGIGIIGPITEETNAVQPLAYEMLVQSLGKEASIDILRSFIGATAELVVELQSAIRNQNKRDAANALRELENSCAFLGAHGILTQCSRMQAHLQNNDWHRLEGTMGDLTVETRIVGQFINELPSQALRGHFRQ